MSGNGGGSGAGPCGACKFLRRKCVNGCIFAPYFDPEQGAAHFAAVHKVFGASNLSKLLLQIPTHKRHDAVVTVCYEAQARLCDPVYGCVAHIFALQQQVVTLQAELAYMQAHLPTLELPSPAFPLQATAPALVPSLSISDLPTASSNLLATFDLSTLLYPLQSPFLDVVQLRNGRTLLENGVGGDFQALARELIIKHGPTTSSSTKARSN